MRYFGGKARIAKQVAKFLNSQLKVGQTFVEPFCGACNVTQWINKDRDILCSDAHASLIALHKHVQSGGSLPNSVSEQEYKYARLNKSTRWLDAFIGFGCSFAGRYFEGYARSRNNANYALQASGSLKNKHKNLSTALFSASSYDFSSVPVASLIYCDIPYKTSTKHYSVGKFDHDEFYLWALSMADAGHSVFVSEYLEGIPHGWEVVFSVESSKAIRSADGTRAKTTEVIITPKRRENDFEIKTNSSSRGLVLA